MNLALADTVRYVVEQAEFAVRVGSNFKNRSVTSVRSGESVTVLEDDSTVGWSRIRTEKGIEGWIQSKVLTDQPASGRAGATVQASLSAALRENRQLRGQIASLEAASRTAVVLPVPSPVPQPACPTPSALPPVQVASPAPSPAVRCETDITDSSSKVFAETIYATRRNWFLGGALVTILGALLGRLLARTRWAPD